MSNETTSNPPGQDPELERMLRAALSARAEATPIRGDGLALIRERVTGRRHGRAWTPILAGAAAAAVIVGIAVVPRIVATPADGNAAAVGPTSSAPAVVESSELPEPTSDSAADLPLSASASASDLTPASPEATTGAGAPTESDGLPISGQTPLIYPYPTSQALADAVKAGSTSSDLAAPEKVAQAFVASAGSTGESYATRPARPSSDVVPGSKGVLVTVLNRDGLAVTNVYLRAVVASGQTVWGVVGASRDGGDTADLTVDPPQSASGSYALSGRFVAPIAGGSTLTVTPSYGEVAATAAGQVQRNVTAAGGRWSVSTSAEATTPPSGVVVTVVVNGRIVALVATTIGS